MANLPVICNTSPLIKLVGVGLLDLLPQMYGAIWIPDVVQQEYQVRARTTDPDLTTLPWLRIHPVTIDPTLQTWSGFGAGEAAVISLGQTQQARLLILDDKRARQIAARRNMAMVGTVATVPAVAAHRSPRSR